jgi:cytoskeletal protein CcmA (bactofilin family)
VTGNIKTKDLLQLRGECAVKGNLNAGKLQVEPTAIFNGQCHMVAETGKGGVEKNFSDSKKESIQASQSIAV